MGNKSRILLEGIKAVHNKHDTPLLATHNKGSTLIRLIQHGRH